ncbi:MAG: Uma2 family endonuclease [Planctomycetota bacterium]|nr:Uma2 family endonuclease [Planctomycetota bacterium]
MPVREARKGYLESIPELVVEIRSKNDTAAYVERKVQDYLTAGVGTIVVIDPVSRTANVFRSSGAPTIVQEREALDLKDTIPGFQLIVGQLFGE